VGVWDPLHGWFHAAIIRTGTSALAAGAMAVDHLLEEGGGSAETRKPTPGGSLLGHA
jgi:hypothetical protein